jgi:hypothetical protein
MSFAGWHLQLLEEHSHSRVELAFLLETPVLRLCEDSAHRRMEQRNRRCEYIPKKKLDIEPVVPFPKSGVSSTENAAVMLTVIFLISR